MKRPFEIEAQALKLKILRHAQEHNLDSEVVVAAVADAVGLIAANLDLRTGSLPLETRLDAFNERVKASHRQSLVMMSRNNQPKEKQS